MQMPDHWNDEDKKQISKWLKSKNIHIVIGSWAKEAINVEDDTWKEFIPLYIKFHMDNDKSEIAKSISRIAAKTIRQDTTVFFNTLDYYGEGKVSSTAVEYLKKMALYHLEAKTIEVFGSMGDDIIGAWHNNIWIEDRAKDLLINNPDFILQSCESSLKNINNEEIRVRIMLESLTCVFRRFNDKNNQAELDLIGYFAENASNDLIKYFSKIKNTIEQEDKGEYIRLNYINHIGNKNMKKALQALSFNQSIRAVAEVTSQSTDKNFETPVKRNKKSKLRI